MTEISKITTGRSVRCGIPVVVGDHPNTVPPVMFSISHHSCQAMVYFFYVVMNSDLSSVSIASDTFQLLTQLIVLQ